jgi:hypothetical protein
MMEKRKGKGRIERRINSGEKRRKGGGGGGV